MIIETSLGGLSSKRKGDGERTAASVFPGEPQGVEPVSQEDWDSFAVEPNSCGKLEFLSDIAEEREETVEDLRYLAASAAEQLAEKAEQLFMQYLRSHFDAGQVEFWLYSEPEPSCHDIMMMYNEPEKLKDGHACFDMRSDDITIGMWTGWGIIDDDEEDELPVLFAVSPISREWFMRCAMAHLVAHLSTAGFSIFDMAEDSVGDELVSTITVKWSTELSEEVLDMSDLWTD